MIIIVICARYVNIFFFDNAGEGILLKTDGLDLGETMRRSRDRTYYCKIISFNVQARRFFVNIFNVVITILLILFSLPGTS